MLRQNDECEKYKKYKKYNQYHKYHNIPILHFDTHSDMNAIRGGQYLSNMNGRNAAQTVWDIGAAMSGVLCSTGLRDLVWCMPEWVPDYPSRFAFAYDRKENSFVSPDQEAKRDSDFEFKNKLGDNHTFRTYTKVRTGAMTVREAVLALKRCIAPHRTFILDIDLDYFVCNGQRRNRDYFTDPIDVKSTHRVIDAPLTNDSWPRNRKTESTKAFRALDREKRYIDRRIRHFLKVMNTLNRQGYRPALISVCDSSNVIGVSCGSSFSEFNSDNNGYVPDYFAMYIHTQIVYGLHRIYQSE